MEIQKEAAPVLVTAVSSFFPWKALNLMGFYISCPHIKTDQIKPAQPYQSVDDSGQPGHASKQESDQVKVEESHQTPVYCTDNRNGQCRTIQCFISHGATSFTQVVCAIFYKTCSLQQLKNKM